jgi:hypothetical protein
MFVIIHLGIVSLYIGTVMILMSQQNLARQEALLHVFRALTIINVKRVIEEKNFF